MWIKRTGGVVLPRVIRMARVIPVDVIMVMRNARHQLDPRGAVDDLHIRVVLCQSCTPYLFKAQVTHPEVDGTLSQVDHHGGGRLIGLGTGAGRHQRVDAVILTRQLFQEVTLRLNGHGEQGLFRLITVCGATTAGNSQHEYQENG